MTLRSSIPTFDRIIAPDSTMAASKESTIMTLLCMTSSSNSRQVGLAAPAPKQK